MPDRYLLSPTAQLDIDNVREIQKMMFSFLSTVHFHCISSLQLFCLQVTVRRLSLSLVPILAAAGLALIISPCGCESRKLERILSTSISHAAYLLLTLRYDHYLTCPIAFPH